MLLSGKWIPRSERTVGGKTHPDVSSVLIVELKGETWGSQCLLHGSIPYMKLLF